MGEIVLEIVVIVALILVNGAFAMAELALVSSRKSRLSQMVDAGRRGATEAISLAEDRNRLLSTVQVGITLIGTLAGAYGGATLADRLQVILSDVAGLRPYAEGIAVGIVVVGISYLTLVLGELVPKRIALGRPEELAVRLSRPIGWLSRLAVPVVALLSRSTDFFLRFLRVPPEDADHVTEEDLHHMIGEGARSGLFEPEEHHLLRRALRLADRRAETLMTPRMSIEWIDLNDEPAAIQARLATSPHSRFPVCEGDLDRVVGVLDTRDLLAGYLLGREPDLRGVLRMPILLYEGTPGSGILEAFRSAPCQVALILDEYGSIAGLMTPNNLLEAIVGDLGGDVDSEIESAALREDGSWLLDGMMPREELIDLVGVKSLPEGEYRTLAGLVLNQLGRIPAVADYFDWNGFRFEVVDMDRQRVDKVMVRPLEVS